MAHYIFGHKETDEKTVLYYTVTTISLHYIKYITFPNKGIYNTISGERMLEQNNPLSNRHHCWHSFHIGMYQGKNRQVTSRLLIIIMITLN